MKRNISIILLGGIALIITWFFLANRKANFGQAILENPAKHQEAPQPLNTNLATAHTITTNPPEIRRPAPTIAALTNDLNAIAATNIGQWKALIKGLRSHARFEHKTFGSESWNMEWPERQGGVPITLQSNDQRVAYTVNFIDVETFLETGNIRRVEIHSPMMSIDETRELGLKLTRLLEIDSKEFTDWCDQVGNHWLDAPLYSSKSGNHLGFATLRTYDDGKPWYVNLVIANP